MAFVREKINRIKVEHWRGVVPIDPALTVYQGDVMTFDTGSKKAILGLSGNTAYFCGISDTSNPIETIGSTSFLSDPTYKFINVVQSGLVELIAGVAATVQPYDAVYLSHQNCQHIAWAGSNSIGFIDPKWAAGGKIVAIGDLVRLWIKVPAAYNFHA